MTPEDVLSTLTHAPPDVVEAFAEGLLDAVGTVQVRAQRTGLVMLPARDAVQGAVFHLGEVLVTEAHVALTDQPGAPEGYAVVLGRRATFALACAIADAAWRAGLAHDVLHAFVSAQASQQAADDQALLRAVAATKIAMDTF